MHSYLFVLIPISLLFSAAALALPWLMVRQGYREIVQVCCACTTLLGACAATGIFTANDNAPMALLYGSGSLLSFLYALDCAAPLYMTRKKKNKA